MEDSQSSYGSAFMDGITKIALVTGAASGIGEAISKELIKLGYVVFAVDTSSDKLSHIQKKISNSFIPITCDTTNKDQVAAASNYILKKNLFPSLFFLNAGIAGDAATENTDHFDLNVYKKTMNINYTGVLLWVDFWEKLCLERNLGSFIVTSSCNALFALPRRVAYAASKAAIAKAFEGLSLTHFKTNLKFLVAYPGPVDTPALRAQIASGIIKELIFTMTSEKTAKHIINCALKGKSSCFPSFFYRVLSHLLHALPNKYAMKLLEKL